MKKCNGCTHWAGGDTAYMAACLNPEVAQSRTPFDHSCTLHTPRIEPVATPSRVQCPKCGGVDLQHQSMGYMFFVLRCKACQYTWP